jgi:hypothetical protein
MTKQFSPAAQTVWSAFLNHSEWEVTTSELCGVAAALRAAADQVVPWRPEPTEESIGPTIDYGFAWALWCKANDVRQELIAIAAELDGTQPSSENV